MTYREALLAATRRLRAAGLETPDRDARALLLWVAGIDAAYLIAEERNHMADDAAARFEAAIIRRLAHEPVSKIIGMREFYGEKFLVSPDVLDPRPDSETLIDAAIETARRRRAHTPMRVLDLGTGSGCLLLTLLRHIPDSEGLGVDVSEAALSVARANAKRLDLAKKAAFQQSDWLEKVDGTFDLVVCNPPYIGESERHLLSRDVSDWDPPLALFAGKSGLAAYERISLTLADALSSTGTGFFEVGFRQADAVAQLFRDSGFDDISFREDIAGIRRCVIVRRAA